MATATPALESTRKQLTPTDAENFFDQWLGDAKRIFEQPINERVGNCHEMSLLAAKRAYEMQIPAIWLYTNKGAGSGHTFCVIADSAEADVNGKWVIDPWAGICCKLVNYRNSFNVKMSEWESGGKRIDLGESGKRDVEPAIFSLMAGLATEPKGQITVRRLRP